MKILMLGIFVLAFFILLRLCFNSSLWEKILVLNLFSSKFVLILISFAVLKGFNYLIDIAAIYSLLGFISIVFITRFIRKRGKI